MTDSGSLIKATKAYLPRGLLVVIIPGDTEHVVMSECVSPRRLTAALRRARHARRTCRVSRPDGPQKSQSS